MKNINKSRISSMMIIVVIIFAYSCHKNPPVENTTGMIHSTPKIYPDYTNLVIPPNIAPLNFKIVDLENNKNTWRKYQVKVFTDDKNSYTIKSSSNIIRFPIKKWRELLQSNKGKSVFFEIYAMNAENTWYKFKKIENTISTKEIDSYLVYRLINASRIWYDMGLYQRNLENFQESAVIQNRTMNHSCINCHVFCNNNPEKMSMHIRTNYSGTLILNNDDKRKVNLKTDYTMSAGVYSEWHPNGNLVTYSVNKISQYYSSLRGHGSEVNDGASDLILYNIEKNEVTTCPEISTEYRENMPAWSPDGKWLYYIRGPKAVNNSVMVFGKYSLMRISYDEEMNTWGDPELVLSAEETGKSITFPRISPSGRFLAFSMTDHGYFTINYAESDIYMMNLDDFSYWPMEVNSHDAESTPYWSHSGDWLVFASKRQDGYFSIPYICHVSEDGKASKAFTLPQKDPDYYNDIVEHYNLPQFIVDKIDIPANQLRDFIYKDPVQARFDTSVNVDALSGATFLNKQGDHEIEGNIIYQDKPE